MMLTRILMVSAAALGALLVMSDARAQSPKADPPQAADSVVRCEVNGASYTVAALTVPNLIDTSSLPLGNCAESVVVLEDQGCVVIEANPDHHGAPVTFLLSCERD